MPSMSARKLVVACLAVSFLMAAATASSAKLLVVGHGRGPGTQAQMYDSAIVIGGSTRVQMLNRLCAKPAAAKDCEPLSAPLRRALEDVLDRPITWVGHRPSDGPTFVVLAPIEWTNAEATASYAWRGTHKFSCFGGGSISFKHDHGSWTAFRGSEYIGCPAH
jgi:hypothetical protein